MRAAAEPEQACLLPELAIPPDTPARFAVMGKLRDPARVFVSAGRVLLEVVITQHLQQHHDARHVLAIWVYPNLGDLVDTERAARALAARMPSHTEVVATGSALYPGSFHGMPVNLLDHVAGIAPVAQLLPTLN